MRSTSEHFQRLAEGQDPFTGEQLVRHRAVCAYTNDRGQPVKTMAHRAGWDATFSAPKSVSLTALVGGDARVRDAHRESVGVALDELERYVQARLGDHPAQATGQWVAARFEHDSARPVDGYAAPQLHTHVVVFNLTRTEDGDIRPLQPRELYKSQPYVTAVYRAELATRLKALGYEIDRGASGQPEIRGYTQDYLDASSPRRQQIQDQLAKGHHRGAEAAEIAAHQTREAKRRSLARRDAAPPPGDGAGLRRSAGARGAGGARAQPAPRARRARICRARGRDVREGAEPGTGRRRGRTRGPARCADPGAGRGRRSSAIKAEFEQRVDAGEFIGVAQRPGAPGRAFTTREMIDLERETIEMMRAGQHAQSGAEPW